MLSKVWADVLMPRLCSLYWLQLLLHVWPAATAYSPHQAHHVYNRNTTITTDSWNAKLQYNLTRNFHRNRLLVILYNTFLHIFVGAYRKFNIIELYKHCVVLT